MRLNRKRQGDVTGNTDVDEGEVHIAVDLIGVPVGRADDRDHRAHCGVGEDLGAAGHCTSE